MIKAYNVIVPTNNHIAPTRTWCILWYSIKNKMKQNAKGTVENNRNVVESQDYFQNCF